MVLSSFLLAVSVWSVFLYYFHGLGDEYAPMMAFALSGLIGAAVGGVMSLLSRYEKKTMGRREALLLVALSWLLGALLSALPFFLWAWLEKPADPGHPFHEYINCYFEAMSGLTTTGATILSKMSDLPHSIHLWRAFTHWVGGLGIVVLFVAVLPSLGVGGKRLYRVEAPGPSPEGVHPQIHDTARVLWYIYLGLTVAEIVALRIAGMSWFDATCHTFGTLATGGFSTKDYSVGQFNSVAIDVIIIVFMVLAGLNFGLYYHLIQRKFKNVFGDVELRLYLGLLLVAGIIISLTLWNQPIRLTTGEEVGPSAGEAVRQGMFTTVSIQTTTGFCTADFNGWPFLARAILILLMFIGGSAGSTSGGIKVIRIWIAFRAILGQIEQAFRPSVVRPLKVGRTPIDTDMKYNTVAYVLGVIVLFALGSVLIMLFEPESHECDYGTAATASIATLCTIGPGLGKVGAVENYGWFTPGSKLVLTLLMLLGRLEIFAVIVLFTPRFWRTK